MNPNDRKLLLRIGATAFRDNLKKNIRFEDTYAKERDTLNRLKNDKNIPREARENAAKMLDNPQLYKKEMKVDPKAERKMAAEVEGIIKDKIRTGELEKPDDTHLKQVWGHQQSQSVKDMSKELNNPNNYKVNADNRN